MVTVQALSALAFWVQIAFPPALILRKLKGEEWGKHSKCRKKSPGSHLPSSCFSCCPVTVKMEVSAFPKKLEAALGQNCCLVLFCNVPVARICSAHSKCSTNFWTLNVQMPLTSSDFRKTLSLSKLQFSQLKNNESNAYLLKLLYPVNTYKIMLYIINSKDIRIYYYYYYYDYY